MKLKNNHFTITKGKTHHFRLSVVLVLAAFTAAMITILLSVFTSDLELLQERPFSRKRASLILSTSRQELKVGETFPATVSLETGFPTTGIDVVIKYDPKFLVLETFDPKNSNPSLQYLDISISAFDIFPYSKLKEEETANLFIFAALTKPLKELRGRGTVASLNFKTLKTGQTKVSFVFNPKDASDSNVAYRGKDVLGQTKDLMLVIK